MIASPWLDIPLADYEGHMALPEIAQARMLADELERAVRQHTPSSVAIIGCSGGNGFERLIGTTVERIVGIDINPTYVAAAQARFGTQLPKLALYVADIQLDFGRFRRRGRGHFACGARYGAEFRYYRGAAGT